MSAACVCCVQPAASRYQPLAATLLVQTELPPISSEIAGKNGTFENNIENTSKHQLFFKFSPNGSINVLFLMEYKARLIALCLQTVAL